MKNRSRIDTPGERACHVGLAPNAMLKPDRRLPHGWIILLDPADPTIRERFNT